MGKDEKNPNRMYINLDLVEDILLRLPLKSILRFKTISKQWRTTIESMRFTERRRMSVQNHRKKILAAEDPTKSRFEVDDKEIDIVFLQCDDATTKPSLTCDGLVCICSSGYVKVLNPTTGEYVSFPSWSRHFRHHDHEIVQARSRYRFELHGCWVTGFGRNKVNGNYKVVRMFSDDNRFEILDITIGTWWKLRPPPYKIEATRKSAYVNGSIYWLNILNGYKILALDLHTQKFHDVLVLPPTRQWGAAQIVNLEDQLAIVGTCYRPEWKLEIWIMDAQEEKWTMTYNISLSSFCQVYNSRRWLTFVAVSKQGSLFFYDDEKNLFKYNPEMDSFHCLSSNICVISPFVENLVPLRFFRKYRTYGYRHELRYVDQVHVSRISNIVERIESLIPDIWLTYTLGSLLIIGLLLK